MAGMHHSSEVRHGIRVNRVAVDDVEVTVLDMGCNPDMRDCPRYMAWYSLDCCEYVSHSRNICGDDIRKVCDALAALAMESYQYTYTDITLAAEGMTDYISDPVYQAMARRLGGVTQV